MTLNALSVAGSFATAARAGAVTVALTGRGVVVTRATAGALALEVVDHHVVACAICGRKGIDPRGLMSPSLSEWVKRELLAVGEPLELDAGGNCIECSQAVAGASSP